MDSAAWAGAFILVGLAVLALIIGLTIIPGIIAKRKNHPYLVWIWVLATVGAWFTGGLGWIAALVWALIPPGQGSTSVSGNSNVGQNFGNVEVASTASSSIENQLKELQRLLDTKQITKTEYDALRKKVLDI